jgi:hypothetical protein
VCGVSEFDREVSARIRSYWCREKIMDWMYFIAIYVVSDTLTLGQLQVICIYPILD